MPLMGETNLRLLAMRAFCRRVEAVVVVFEHGALASVAGVRIPAIKLDKVIWD